jgi:malonate decarboxylase beta subunit
VKVGNAALTFSGLRATERAVALLDRGTFIRLAETTPESPFVVGSGFLDGVRVMVALLDGHVRGGTIGVAEAMMLADLAHRLVPTPRRHRRPPVPLILGFDTGGVRVQEGPRALAAASAVGVALARLTLLGVRLAAVISGPRGCFGAPAVMAALPEHVIMTENAHWGLTGPKLLRGLADAAAPGHDGYAATAAATRLQNGDTQAVVPDSPRGVRDGLLEFVRRAAVHPGVTPLAERMAASARVAGELLERWRRSVPAAPHAPAAGTRRRRDLLRYSFRGQWRPDGRLRRHGLMQASLGTLGGHAALALIIGPEPAGGGVGIEEAAACTALLREACARDAAVLSFMFCQGHAVDAAQEHCGLQRALAECLRSLVATRLRGQPVVSVLGGGTYGAAYLAFAAPSHRILAIRGTSVAPMAPRVLRAFQALRGANQTTDAAAHLAELIPDIHIVESVIRLPRALRTELTQLLAGTPPEVPRP